MKHPQGASERLGWSFDNLLTEWQRSDTFQEECQFMINCPDSNGWHEHKHGYFNLHRFERQGTDNTHKVVLLSTLIHSAGMHQASIMQFRQLTSENSEYKVEVAIAGGNWREDFNPVEDVEVDNYSLGEIIEENVNKLRDSFDLFHGVDYWEFVDGYIDLLNDLETSTKALKEYRDQRSCKTLDVSFGRPYIRIPDGYSYMDWHMILCRDGAYPITYPHWIKSALIDLFLPYHYLNA